MEEKKPKKEKKFELVQVATQHAPAIQSPEGELLTIEEAIVEMANDLKEIKKLLG